MYPENIKRRLEYKLRELELIIKQISRDAEASDMDVELALEKTGQLYDLLYRLQPGASETERERQPVPTGRPVIPPDPDPVENNNIYEAEGIIPSPSGSMKHERPAGDKHQLEGKQVTPVKKEPGPGDRGIIKPEESPQKGGESSGGTGEGSQETGTRETRGTLQSSRENSRETGARETRESSLENSRETGARETRETGKGLQGTGEDSGEPGSNDPGEKHSRTGKSEQVKPGSPGKKYDRPSDIEIIADKYQSSQNYINQAIAGKQARKDLTSRLQSRPIADLRSSIGLNDKFLFIKEIFKGSPESYNQCVDDLNKAATYEEALHTARTKYSLDEKTDAVKRLLVLVKRKIQNA
jgi:hypothetical protein